MSQPLTIQTVNIGDRIHAEGADTFHMIVMQKLPSQHAVILCPLEKGQPKAGANARFSEYDFNVRLFRLVEGAAQ